MNLPVAIVARVISNKKAKEALAASTVKIAGRDVLATWKVLVALGLMPVLYFTYSVMFFIYLRRYDMTLLHRLLTAWAAWALIPFVTYASIRFGEVGVDIFKSIRPLFLSITGEDNTIDDLRHPRICSCHPIHAFASGSNSSVVSLQQMVCPLATTSTPPV